jgi:DNA-binding MarR family transcriptional regulator
LPYLPKQSLRLQGSRVAAAAFYRANTLSTENSVSYAMKRAQGYLRQLLDKAFEQKEITFPQWVVLICLRDGVGRTAADLSRCLHHDSGSLTRLIDQLEKRELVKRHHSTVDRRVYELVLTPQGRAVLNALIHAVSEVYNEVLSDFSHAEVETLLRLLRKVMTGAESLSARRRVPVRRIER